MASATPTMTLGRDPCVLWREFVAVDAVSRRGPQRASETASCVLSGRDGLEVIGIHAQRHSAEMVQLMPGRNDATCALEGKPVSLHGMTVKPAVDAVQVVGSTAG